jgi:hypothetical protein
MGGRTPGLTAPSLTAPGLTPPDLAALRRRAGGAIWLESLTRAAVPAAGILLGYAALTLFGLGNPWAFCGLLAAAILWLGLGLWRLQPPGAQRVDRRIEHASNLPHRPLAVLDDAPQTDDPLARLIWQRHLASAEAALRTARAGPPLPVLPARDPLALRLLLLLLLATGLVIAGPAAPSRLAAGFAWPASPFAAPGVTAWITPPAYDPAPPVLLAPGQRVAALAGSRLTVMVSGLGHKPFIALAGATIAPAALGDAAYRADFPLTRAGTLVVGPWWARLAHWHIDITAPAAPVIALSSVSLSQGTNLVLRFHITDPYGIARLTALLAPVGHARALTQAIPLTPGTATAWADLADSPYRGLDQSVTLTATNLAGVTASLTAPHNLRLPPATLHDPTALRLAALRQQLALAPATQPAIGAATASLAAQPLSPIAGALDIQLAALAEAMRLNATTPPATVDRLGSLIDAIEAGPDAAPARALAQAESALLRALQQGLQGHPPTAAALQSLLQAMQQALARHLAALRPPTGPSAPAAPLDLSALNNLASRIMADEAAGRTAQAAAELQQLQAALNALQSARPMTAAEAARAAAANQAAQTLGQLTNGEAQMLDQTHQGTATPDDQQVLQSALQAMRKNLAGAGLSLPGLGPAARNMAAAAHALGTGDAPSAESAESATIAQLQRAAAALQAETRNDAAIGQNGPASNPNGFNGPPDEDSTPGLGQPGANPAAAIEQQIIRQDANPALPAPTHRYFRRLLAPDPASACTPASPAGC